MAAKKIKLLVPVHLEYSTSFSTLDLVLGVSGEYSLVSEHGALFAVGGRFALNHFVDELLAAADALQEGDQAPDVVDA